MVLAPIIPASVTRPRLPSGPINRYPISSASSAAILSRLALILFAASRRIPVALLTALRSAGVSSSSCSSSSATASVAASRKASRVPIAVLRRLLGHSDIKTTMIYLHVQDDLALESISHIDM